MQPTNKIQIVNVEALDFLTDREKGFNRAFVDKLTAFANGEGNVEKMKVLTAGAVAIVHRQKARCVAAALLASGKISLPDSADVTEVVEQRSSVEMAISKNCERCGDQFDPEFENQTLCKPCLMGRKK